MNEEIKKHLPTKKAKKVKKEKGNFNSIKVPHENINKGGRPAFYKTPEELQEKIDEYFEVQCADEIMLDSNNATIVDVKGRPVIHYNPPTLSGLALFLGFVDRCSLYDYRDRKCEKKTEETDCMHEKRLEITQEFSHTIKKALARIEDYAEKQLHIGNSTGAIFWLKNRGWKDKTEVETSGEITQRTVYVTKEDKKNALEHIDSVINKEE